LLDGKARSDKCVPWRTYPRTPLSLEPVFRNSLEWTCRSRHRIRRERGWGIALSTYSAPTSRCNTVEI